MEGVLRRRPGGLMLPPSGSGTPAWPSLPRVVSETTAPIWSGRDVDAGRGEVVVTGRRHFSH